MTDPLPKENPLFRQVQALKENSDYRIADAFLARGPDWQQIRKTIRDSDKYKNTVLYEYLTRMRHEGDFPVLRTVVGERTNTRPGDNELVIHLRLGDVMKTEDHRGFRSSLANYGNLWKRFRFPPFIKDATIVTALHFSPNVGKGRYNFTEDAVEKSAAVFSTVEAQLAKTGLAVKVQSSTDVDEDFAYMCNAKFFLKGLTVMSDIAAHCHTGTARTWTFDPKWKSVGRRLQFARLQYGGWLQQKLSGLSDGR